jgi:uncharacterized protein
MFGLVLLAPLAPALQTALETAARALGLDLNVAPTDHAGDLVTWLSDQQPRLAVAHQDALEHILTLKSSPATRKIPVLGVIEDGGDSGLLRRAGCVAVVQASDILSDARALIETHARPDERAEIARAAALPLPELARTAIAQFNAGEYWEQHESFEAAWRAEPGPIRQLYQGILQVGVAYLQIQRKNYIGARKLFLRARQYLAVLPAVCQGVDVAQLRDDARRALAMLEALGPERIAEFPPALFQPVRLNA